MSFIDQVLSLPSEVLNYWGYWVVFFAALFEASPFFGLLIPGQSIVILGGFFVKLGILSIGNTIFITALGAIFGDLFGYFLGRKYGSSFIINYGKYFFFKKEHFEKTKRLMSDHTGTTLIVGRFNSITRAFAPFAAGSSDIPFIKFLTYSIIGGISWAISFVFVGYIFGKSYEVVSQYIGKFILIAIGVSIVLVFLYRFINKRKHIFSKYYLCVLTLNIFSLSLFSKITEDVLNGEFITKLDIWVNSKMDMLWNPLLSKIFTLMTNIINPMNLGILSLLLLTVLLFKKKWYYSSLLILSMTSGLLFGKLTKGVIHRSGQENALFEISEYSFPSDHAIMTIIFFTLLLFAFKNDIKNRALKTAFVMGNITAFFIIGFSGIYLNIHWLSDTMAGFSLGIFWISFFVLAFKVSLRS